MLYEIQNEIEYILNELLAYYEIDNIFILWGLYKISPQNAYSLKLLAFS